MFIHTRLRESKLEKLHDLRVEYPFGLLVTHGSNGHEASPVPFLLYADEGQHGVLRAHIARASSHWNSIAGLPEFLVVLLCSHHAEAG